MTDTNGSGVNMTNTKGRRTGAGIAAGLVALALIAGACGGGAEEEEDTLRSGSGPQVLVLL